MAVPTAFSELSTTAASNPPADSEGVSQGDDQFRAVYAFIRSLYEGSSNGQLVFPATQNASSNANTLDDYEEGTFTPTDASGASLSFSSATGRYIKVGKAVNFQLTVTFPLTESTASALIGALPFTSANATFPVATVTATANATQARVQASSVQLAIFTSAGSQTTNVQLSGTVVTAAGWYEATA